MSSCFSRCFRVPIAMRDILRTMPVDTSALSAHESRLTPQAVSQNALNTKGDDRENREPERTVYRRTAGPLFGGGSDYRSATQDGGEGVLGRAASGLQHAPAAIAGAEAAAGPHLRS